MVDVTCKGAKVATIYKALMQWHIQNGEEQTNGEGSLDAEGIEAGPSTSRGGRKSTTSSRPRNSVQFNLPPSREHINFFQNNNSQKTLANFLMSFSGVVQNISHELHTEFMMDVLNIMKDYEKRSKVLKMQTN